MYNFSQDQQKPQQRHLSSPQVTAKKNLVMAQTEGKMGFKHVVRV